MAFEGLTEKLSATFKKLRGKGRLKESDVKEAMREIRLALLEADVSYKVVKDFTKSVTERCIGADVLESLTPAQMIVKIVNEELTRLMGSETQHITINPKGPTVVMLVGLQGAGKTTNGSKLAGLMKRQGRNPLLVACDIYRPAAIRQLEVCGEKLGLPVFQMGQTNPVDIAKAAVQHAIRHGNDMVFLDTAGRLHIDETLMEELKAVKAAVNPQNGVTEGTSEETFSPHEKVTREQAATFLYRYATNVLGFWFTLEGDLSGYTDGDRISEFAAEAILWATDAGIFQGFPDGTFQPQGALTRAQLAKILTVLNRYAASYSPW